VNNKPPKDYTGKAPIYQQWMEKEFAFDTMHLHWQARLLYKDLLQKAWHLSTRPDVPSDDNQLQNILGVPPEVWEQHRDAVRAMFTRDAETGLLAQKRLREDWKTITNYRQKQKELAERRWNTNADTEAQTQQSQGTCQGTSEGIAEPMPAKQSEAKRSKEREKEDSDPNPSLAQPSPSAPVNGKDSEQEDISRVQAACFELTGKTPTPASVEKLLAKFPAKEIISEFKWYFKGLAMRDKDYAEKTYFADGGAFGVVLSARQKDWEEDIGYWAASVSEELIAEDPTYYTIERYLKDNPPPTGMSNHAADVIKKATEQCKKSLNKFYDEYPQYRPSAVEVSR
jgi:uncharacterized protein YdaU (DUF1376 family)